MCLIYSLFYEPQDFYVDCTNLNTNPNGGVAIAHGWTVKKLDVFERKAILEDGYEITYEKCLIATGKVYDVQWVHCSPVCKHAAKCKIKLVFTHCMSIWTQAHLIY